MKQKAMPRAIPLEDIRYLECADLLGDGSNPGYAENMFNVPKRAWALASRLATVCRREKICVAKRSLYVCFTPALGDGVVRPTEFQGETWQRYVMYGISSGFNDWDEALRVDYIWRATLNCLYALAPDQSLAINRAALEVEVRGEDFAVPLNRKATRKYIAELSYTLPALPDKAQLKLALTEVSSETVQECVLFDSKLSAECGFLGGRIKIEDDEVVVYPQANRLGRYYAKRNDISALVVSISGLLAGRCLIERRPHRADGV